VSGDPAPLRVMPPECCPFHESGGHWDSGHSQTRLSGNHFYCGGTDPNAPSVLVAKYHLLRWAVGNEQVDRAIASVESPEGREYVVARLAAGDTIDDAGKWTPAKRYDPASLSSLVKRMQGIERGRHPCEALRSRDPGQVTP
jgi:hypothetical protein